MKDSPRRAVESRWVETVVVLCCAVDAADKALLASCFHALQLDLHASPSQLGALSFFQSIAFSLALPVWGALTSEYSSRVLLSAGCLIWATSTAFLSITFSFPLHCVLRVFNGIGLCGVMPISQAVLMDIVPEEKRGTAFGKLGAFSNLTSMIAAWYAVSVQSQRHYVGGVEFHGWQLVHMQIAIVSFFLGGLVLLILPEVGGSRTRGGVGIRGTWVTVRKILGIPSFVLLVLQGVTGGIPWNAMAFMNLYYISCGYTDAEAGRFMLVVGVGGAAGALLGGVLGDFGARLNPDRGRVYVALTSVCLGVPTFTYQFYGVPREPHWYLQAAAAFSFSIVSGWTPAAANRPICADLVNSASERAQIVAWWVMLEGVSASILGAPLVGFLSEMFGYRLDGAGEVSGPESAESLARALVGVAIISWVCCGAAWVGMAFTFPGDRKLARLGLPDNKDSRE